jgi:hypothetical protein
MPQPDVLPMLWLIDKKICSAKIDVRHLDVLIRLREILEKERPAAVATSDRALGMHGGVPRTAESALSNAFARKETRSGGYPAYSITVKATANRKSLKLA